MGWKGKLAVLAVGCRRLASPAAPTAAGKVGDFTGRGGATTEPIICFNRLDQKFFYFDRFDFRIFVFFTSVQYFSIS